MRQRKPIDQYDTVFFKYSKENVQSHKQHPEWFPKVGVEGMCIMSDNGLLKVKWDQYDDSYYIEAKRVGVKRRKNA
jgi:hypothetical protein